MNAVGIDVSKGKSMVAVMHPFGKAVAAPFEVGHTESELKELARFLKSLPGETRDMLLEQCAIISSLPLRSVKFHQLQIVKGTAMEKEYAAAPSAFYRPGLDEYLDLVALAETRGTERITSGD